MRTSSHPSQSETDHPLGMVGRDRVANDAPLTREQLLENMVRVFIRAGEGVEAASTPHAQAVASMILEGAVAAGKRLLGDV